MRAVVAMIILAAVAFSGGDARAEPAYGPFNAEFPAGGDGLVKSLPTPGAKTALLAAEPWTLTAWVAPSETVNSNTLIAGVGEPGRGGRFLVLTRDGFGVWSGVDALYASSPMAKRGWRFLAAIYDGRSVTLAVDGVAISTGPLATADAASLACLGPRGVSGFSPFAGRLAGFSMTRRAMTSADLAAMARIRPDADLIAFETGSPRWPVQTRAMAGQVTPQPAWTLPRSSAPTDPPAAVPPYDGPALVPSGEDRWRVRRWTLAAAPAIGAGGAVISTPAFDDKGWYAATVPGTALTTLVDRGVYPDPDRGLNNLAIPERLAHQDYWYRARFTAPAAPLGRRAFITLEGVNYAAEIWLNGDRLGVMRGAFIRGRFDITEHLRRSGENVLAVRVSPPPHPGVAQEESIAAGPGENGGMEALDGPTFIASEGWDWIPTVRDRNTGLWRPVDLTYTGDLTLGDPQVVTTLPRSDNSEADVEISAPVENLSSTPLLARVVARVGGVTVERTATLPPGVTQVKFAPADFPSLAIRDPALWWPNGYGAPALQDLTLTVEAGGQLSDLRRLRFGLRQITYELSLMDTSGHVRREEVDFSRARALGQSVIDVSHEGIRKVPGGWVESLTPQGIVSPAVRAVPDEGLGPYLTLKVNGVRIAARGGSWGTDDWRKRLGRDRLEPFFRLHKEAGLNIIRNWVGQNTEDEFYDLADEYGLLVLNDFWASTQDYQLEPEDVPLFLANAADVIARYRNHPSIAVWFGRNEGVPQPILNEGLARLVNDLDGTRWYTGSSNRIELQDSGPYDYRPPAGYFTAYAKGFAVEVGSPSFPTLEAFEAAVAPPDRWPVSDAWAYHDWHQAGNGAVGGFMEAMTRTLGAPTGLEDFERKAQLMNYETYRAIFEGMNAGLWTRNSGRLLWMTQPAWPSTEWQIYSHDYDTHAAYYGVKAAAEPAHVQLNLATGQLDVVNTHVQPIIGARVRTRVVALDGRLISDTVWPVDAAGGTVTHGPILDLDAALAREDAVLARLDLTDSSGEPLSRNLYWRTRDGAAGSGLSHMTAQPVTLEAESRDAGAERLVIVRLINQGPGPALQAKLTLVDGEGRRILPAYYSDNYVSLLPGEARTLEIRYPAAAAPGAAGINLRGWNVRAARISIRPQPVAGTGPVDPRVSN